MAFLVTVIGFNLAPTGLFFISLGAFFFAILMIFFIDKKEQDILSAGTDMHNYENIFDCELYLVVMLHELERLTLSEEYAHEKHIHAIIGRHMEECKDKDCLCRNYEPEYDKKFTNVFVSKRLTKTFSSYAGGGAGGSGSSLGKQNSNSNMDLKKLPYKINYRTKVEIFKKEFE